MKSMIPLILLALLAPGAARGAGLDAFQVDPEFRKQLHEFYPGQEERILHEIKSEVTEMTALKSELSGSRIGKTCAALGVKDPYRCFMSKAQKLLAARHYSTTGYVLLAALGANVIQGEK